MIPGSDHRIGFRTVLNLSNPTVNREQKRPSQCQGTVLYGPIGTRIGSDSSRSRSPGCLGLEGRLSTQSHLSNHCGTGSGISGTIGEVLVPGNSGTIGKAPSDEQSHRDHSNVKISTRIRLLVCKQSQKSFRFDCKNSVLDFFPVTSWGIRGGVVVSISHTPYLVGRNWGRDVVGVRADGNRVGHGGSAVVSERGDSGLLEII
eukprot:749664-Hanusia_phi.AAC.3